MAADETILTWNFSNWVTVLIMVGLGFALVNALLKVYRQKKQGA